MKELTKEEIESALAKRILYIDTELRTSDLYRADSFMEQAGVSSGRTQACTECITYLKEHGKDGFVEFCKERVKQIYEQIWEREALLKTRGVERTSEFLFEGSRLYALVDTYVYDVGRLIEENLRPQQEHSFDGRSL